jgi:preprotein translocase subunit SecD
VYPRVALPLWMLTFFGCSPSDRSHPPDWRQVPVSLELRLAQGASAPGLVPAKVHGQAHTVYLHPDVLLSNREIARVEAQKTMARKGLVLEVWLTKSGSERMAEATARHIGDSLAVLIDSVVVAVPTIQDKIGGDTTLPNVIGVPLAPEEAEHLAQAIRKTWPPRTGSTR